MNLVFRLIFKLLAAGLLILFLGLNSFIDALNQWKWGQGALSFSDAISAAVVGGLNTGFQKTYIFFTTIGTDLASKNAGNIIMNLWYVAILYVFLFVLIWVPVDLLTGKEADPLWIPALLALLILAIVSVWVGSTTPTIFSINGGLTQTAVNTTAVLDIRT